ncbi:MAG: D-glycero-beta-D-manno-heptose-7-phosphate kinase [Acidobacteriota bacterium]
MSIDRSCLTKALERFEGRSILVIGDLILDKFIWGKVERISPEAPVPVVEVLRESLHLGGAANVAANLRVLGANPLLIGVIGQDEAGDRLLQELARMDINSSGVVIEAGRLTTIKTRIMAQHQQICRTDWEDRKPVPDAARSQIVGIFKETVPRADAVVLSDYAKGVLMPDMVRAIINGCVENGKFVAVDPKLDSFSNYRGASIITPNQKEAERASGVRMLDEPSFLEAGRRLLEIVESEYVLITRGEEGMSLFDRSGHFHIPTVTREVYDVTGAGDTVISTLTLAVAAGASLREAALLANHAAGIAVAKLGTASVTRQELLASLKA